VAIDGDTIVAGAPFDDVGANSGQGSAYTFARTGPAARTETAKLTASDGIQGDSLGGSVSIDGDTIVASAPFDDDVSGNSGSVYTFARTGPAARTETAEATASDGAPNDSLGWSVAVDGDTIVAGVPFDEAPNFNQGSAAVFTIP
jgi:FG-GAP repeat